MIKSLFFFLGCSFLTLSQNVWALTQVTQAAVNNNILFIDNQIDNEYFITPSKLDPRISGANVWVKFGTSQISLAYMGLSNWAANLNYFRDMWIEDSPMIEPFRGIRCTTNSTLCPSTGYIDADLTDKDGIYHAKATGSGIGGGYYGSVTLSDSAFEHFRMMSVGGSETYNLNFCYTTVDYDYASGERCKDQATGSWRAAPYTINKIGHLSLESTNALQELWIASDGTPSISQDNGYCELGVVSNVDGVICKMIAYDLDQTSNLTSSLRITMYANSTLLGFTPAAATLKYSGDGSTWTNYNAAAIYYNIFSTGGEYVYVFFSKTFLKNMVDAGVSITNNQPFTFAFTNSVTPESGYYEFTPSLQLNIVPKEYGISILSSYHTNSASGSGTIGDESPIEMDYVVTVSGPTQADSITAQVVGDSTTINDTPYCLFTSAQGGISVPIPAYLQYTNASGSLVKERNSCSEEPIGLESALWQQTPWDANNMDDGSFYTTNLTLLFPMDDSRSTLTVSSADWEGVVSASGEVKVTANWVGVSK